MDNASDRGLRPMGSFSLDYVPSVNGQDWVVDIVKPFSPSSPQLVSDSTTIVELRSGLPCLILELTWPPPLFTLGISSELVGLQTSSVSDSEIDP